MIHFNQEDIKAKPLANTIVTAADANYFRSLCQFIYTYTKEEYKNSQLVCYDLGLTPGQLERLEKFKKKIPGLSVRKFYFENYPPFVNISYKTYSFKPIIVKELLYEKKGNILWLDSATIVLKPLDNVWQHINQTGLYTPKSGTGTLKEWTVQETLDFMNVPTYFYEMRNVAGGVCGFSYNNVHVRQLVDDWQRHSLIHECIKPKGANRFNHRDDQSLLTILVYKAQQNTAIKLTPDELNISSGHPVKSYSVRNILHPTFPFGFDYWSVLYFTIQRQIDILVNRYKKRAVKKRIAGPIHELL